MRILVANSKGGTGKSTIAVNIASELAKLYSVSFLDLDFSNKTSSEFYADRDDLEYFESRSIEEIASIYKRSNYTVVDAGGWDNDIMRAVISTANVILVPYNTGDLEERALIKFLSTVREIGTIKGNRVILVPNRVHHSSTKDTVRAKIAPLLDMGYELGEPVSQSANFSKAFNKFQTVYEYGSMTQYEQILKITNQIKEV